ncbi:MAG: hypothetical protein WBP56_10945 [Polyangia bacterium]
MNSKSLVFRHRYADSLLLIAAFASGCYGSGASTYSGAPPTTGGAGTTTAGGGTTGAGGETSGGGNTSAGGTTGAGGETSSGGNTSAGGTTGAGAETSGGGTTSSGGTTTSAGGTTTRTGGTTTSAGGTTTSAGGTTTSAGGTTTSTGGTTTSSGGTTTSAGGTTTRTGGTTTSAGGTTTSAGGTTTRTGGTTTSAGGTTTSSGGTTGTGTTPAWGTPVAGGPTGTGDTATVTVAPGTTVGTIGPEFIGFSYEKTHITNDSLNSTNTNLIALYKLLGSPVMRLGADDVDNCNWAGTGTAPSQPSGQPFTKSITTGMVDQLCSFLAATGTRIIYGVNFKSDNVTASAAEAAYAMGKCGSSIYGFEIGNEINRYGSWDTLKTEWESFATAIVATPGALLIGPVAGGGDALSLSTPFAADESAKFGSKLVLLTQHYYAGTAGTTTATVARLQTPDPDSATSQDGLVGTDSTMNTAATTNKIPDGYRLGECNTFSGHGQQGVSDTLIAGLWGLDLMFVTAENGGSGVNLHGGEQGMDGSRDFYYEPIMELNGAVVEVQPIYYSMLVFRMAGTGPMVSTTVTTTNPNFTAYAIKADGFVSVVLDNKNATDGVNATVNLGSAVSSASAIYLQGTPAGSLTAAATAVTLAGASVTASGVWNRNPPYIQTTSGNTFSAYIPPASAALVRVLQ